MARWAHTLRGALRRWLSQRSIRTILPVAVVTPVLVVALVLTALAYRTGRRNANDLAGQSTRQIHERIENHLNHLMDLPPAIGQLIRAHLRDGSMSLDDPAQSRRMVFETLRAFPDVSSVVLGSARGQNVWVIRYPGESTYEYAIKPTPDGPMQEYTMGADGQVGATPLRTYAYDPRVRPWYRAAVEAGGPTWGEVYVWVRGGRGVTLGVPYVEPYRDERGAMRGVVNCELTLADISAFLRRLEIGKTGLAFIVERDGNLIANSVGLDSMKNGVARLAATASADPRIAAAAKALPGVFGPLAAIDGVRLGHATIGGEPTQVVVSPFHNRHNLDWLVVTLVPDADFLAGVQRSRTRSLLIGLAAVLATLGLGIALAMWLLRPIVAVVAHARHVGGGDLNVRLDRRDNREIGELCHALNDMADGLQDRMRLRHALDLAMEVQQSLLPARTPQVKGLEIAARSKYCDETGGDYYDYLEVAGMGPDAVMIAMGDVTGHGIAAAMLMATARGVLRSQVRAQGSLGALLTHVNEHLAADMDGSRFMTMFLAVVDAREMSMRWASAGHDQPIIYDPSDGVLTEIDAADGGLPLGIQASEVYEERTYRRLRPGQIMLVGTDGLWEAMNDAGEQFGKQRVGNALAELGHLPAGEIEAGLYRRLEEFSGGRPNADDITYVVIKFVGVPQGTNGDGAERVRELAGRG